MVRVHPDRLTVVAFSNLRPIYQRPQVIVRAGVGRPQSETTSYFNIIHHTSTSYIILQHHTSSDNIILQHHTSLFLYKLDGKDSAVNEGTTTLCDVVALYGVYAVCLLLYCSICVYMVFSVNPCGNRLYAQYTVVCDVWCIIYCMCGMVWCVWRTCDVSGVLSRVKNIIPFYPIHNSYSH